MSLLLILRTANGGEPVFPPLPPAYPLASLPAGDGGARFATAAPLRAPSPAPLRRKETI
jgi:hypothetical protein